VRWRKDEIRDLFRRSRRRYARRIHRLRRRRSIGGGRDRAPAIIASGEGLRRWQEAKPAQLAERRAPLDEIARQLARPARAPKKLEPAGKSTTDLQRGDVLVFRADDTTAACSGLTAARGSIAPSCRSPIRSARTS
jgi:hypothetical protein